MRRNYWSLQNVDLFRALEADEAEAFLSLGRVVELPVDLRVHATDDESSGQVVVIQRGEIRIASMEDDPDDEVDEPSPTGRWIDRLGGLFERFVALLAGPFRTTATSQEKVIEGLEPTYDLAVLGPGDIFGVHLLGDEEERDPVRGEILTVTRRARLVVFDAAIFNASLARLQGVGPEVVRYSGLKLEKTRWPLSELVLRSVWSRMAAVVLSESGANATRISALAAVSWEVGLHVLEEWEEEHLIRRGGGWLRRWGASLGLDRVGRVEPVDHDALAALAARRLEPIVVTEVRS